MKLTEYNLSGWIEGMIDNQIAIGPNRILLLSLDRSASPPIHGRRNLLAVDQDDNIAWIAELPSELYDSYYEMSLVDGVIVGRSSNSYVSEIDVETGIILRRYIEK